MNAPDNHDLEKCALVQAVNPAIKRQNSDALFLEHLPTQLTAIKRLYAARLRKAYEAGDIDDATAIELCELIKSPKLTEGSLEEKLFFNILGISSAKPDATAAERKFLQELTEWMLVGVLGKETAELLKKIVSSSKVQLTEDDIESIRSEYCIRTEKILDGVRKKKFALDFRTIPPEIIPFLSKEVREFMFQITRKNKGNGKVVYNPEIIHHSQNKVLEKSLLQP